MIRPFQLGKINIVWWNVLNGRIRRFAERQGVAGIGNYTACDGYDNASGIALDGNRMIWTWKLGLLPPLDFYCVLIILALRAIERPSLFCRITLPRYDCARRFRHSFRHPR